MIFYNDPKRARRATELEIADLQLVLLESVLEPSAHCLVHRTAAHSQAQTSGCFFTSPTLRPTNIHGVARAEKNITAGLA